MGAHYERARLLFRQGRYEMAGRELRDELAANPYDGQTHAFLGRCLAQQKQFADALAEGEEGVRLAPHLAYAHYMLALTYSDCGRPKEAEAAVVEALRLDPRNCDQLAWLAWLQFQRGDRRAALDTTDQGLALDPQHVTCLNRRGYILRWMGDSKASEPPLRAALALAPEDAYIHTNLGWTLWGKAHASARVGAFFQPCAMARRPELREARDHFREALRLDPGSDWARTGLAEVLLLRGRAVSRASAASLAAGLLLLAYLAARVGPSAGVTLVMGLVLATFDVWTVAFSDGPAYLLMRRDPAVDALLPPGRRKAAAATAACLACALGAAAALPLAPPPTAFCLLFLSLAFVRPLTAACEASAGWPRRLMSAYTAAFGAVGIALVGSMPFIRDADGRILPAMLLGIAGGVASLRSAQLGQYLDRRFGKKAG